MNTDDRRLTSGAYSHILEDFKWP